MRRRTQAKVSTPPGGSPVGWTLYSTALKCWRMFFLRYMMGLTTPTTPPELLIGSIYHALMDGKDEGEIKSWGSEWVEHFQTGKALYDERTRPERPPLPKVFVSEQTAEMPEGNTLHGRFTSKPDRIEGKGNQRSIREFKTAGTLHDADDLRWAIDGEVIGEMITTGVNDVTVDIITKGEQTRVRQLQVTMTEKKRSAWLGLIEDLVLQIRHRVFEYERNPIEAAEDLHFPRSLPSCVSYGGTVCPFYTYCWTEGASKLLYKKKPNTAWRERLLG